jgi:hypothetical protein
MTEVASSPGFPIVSSICWYGRRDILQVEMLACRQAMSTKVKSCLSSLQQQWRRHACIDRIRAVAAVTTTLAWYIPITAH